MGRAGYLAACLMLDKKLKKSIIPKDVTLQLCNLTIESGRQYSKEHSHPSPLMYAYYTAECLGMFCGCVCTGSACHSISDA